MKISDKERLKKIIKTWDSLQNKWKNTTSHEKFF